MIALLGVSHPGLVLLAEGAGTAEAAVGAVACEIGLSAEDVVQLVSYAATKRLGVQIDPTLAAA
jgi:hypothetical protein